MAPDQQPIPLPNVTDLLLRVDVSTGRTDRGLTIAWFIVRFVSIPKQYPSDSMADRDSDLHNSVNGEQSMNASSLYREWFLPGRNSKSWNGKIVVRLRSLTRHEIKIYRKSSWKLNKWLQRYLSRNHRRVFHRERESFIARSWKSSRRSLMKNVQVFRVTSFRDFPARWSYTVVIHAAQRYCQRAVTIIRRI